ncbi:hypothetical protein B0H11DRAFT_1934715 [Mycena galericulata]|nr:hypothetical protein B0H11DRAFT_1934715 [Mycena galericulata]
MSWLMYVSSPLTPLPPSRDISPTLTEVANGWRPTLKTYSKRDRMRFLAERKSKEAQAKVEAQAKASTIKRAKAIALAKRRRQFGRPTRHSARLLRHRTDPTLPEVWNAEKLVAHGHIIHAPDPEATTPLIDNKGYVTAVIAGPPKDQKRLWVHVMQHANKAMGRIYRNAVFPNLGHEESRVRFGIGFGDLPGGDKLTIYDGVPDTLLNDITFIKTSEAFQTISAYQNPQTQISPAFPDSVFTTTEIAFGDGPQLSRKNREARFDTMEALTVGGTYAWEEGRPLLVFWDDFAVFPLRPGTTVLYPAGTKRFSFVGVAPHETFYIFQQFCHAEILRWIEKDFRSDYEFEADPLDHEWDAFREQRKDRARQGIKLYAKINDIYVF